ncbi:MAG: DNA repair protein RecN [Clostridia bacterium]|nr:DNA repair protein RecN [Clostridia bacterium]
MLQSLTIRNIALIDNLTIELSDGFNVLTGETGAGKSLIIDSLALLLGEKADKTLISYGSDFASVEAVFETTSEEVLSKLEEFGLERENTIIIYRKLSVDGRNECRVNGKSFTLSMLKTITSPLMDLHGQFQHQELLKESCQLSTLDEFGGEDLLKVKKEFKEIFYRLKQIKKQLSSFNFDSRDREKLLDLYDYQIKEIEEANFVSGEEETLKEFRMKVLNQEKIALSIGRISSYFEGSGMDSGVVELIKKCDHEFGEILRYMPEQEELAGRISSARYEIQDIADTVESLQGNLSFDEYSAAENEKRLDLLSSLKKKYGANIDEINAYLENIKAEYDKLVNSAELVEKLEKEKQQAIEELDAKAKELTAVRKMKAEMFSIKVREELAELSMKGAKFEIDFEQLNSETCDELGYDKIRFMFTANSGQPLRPLNKVASGGEMSRFMLAVKNITADIDGMDTMIFDEIDSGISGDTANVLAMKLAKIGKNHQVVCVTHLAQVASFGKNHFYISKAEVDGKTKTSLQNLDYDGRVREIARIIGGSISDFSLSHAKLMLEAGLKF